MDLVFEGIAEVVTFHLRRDAGETAVIFDYTLLSSRWMPDEIAYAAFCHMKDLKIVPVTEYDRRFDIWVIDAELSEGCGGPEIVEEIII